MVHFFESLVFAGGTEFFCAIMLVSGADLEFCVKKSGD